LLRGLRRVFLVEARDILEQSKNVHKEREKEQGSDAQVVLLIDL
jgi:hypothetical protein